jgi:hypothetical protein
LVAVLHYDDYMRNHANQAISDRASMAITDSKAMMQGTIVMSGAYRCNVLKPKGGDYRAEMWKTALLMSRAVLLPPPWIEEEKHLEVQYMLTKAEGLSAI